MRKRTAFIDELRICFTYITYNGSSFDNVHLSTLYRFEQLKDTVNLMLKMPFAAMHIRLQRGDT